MLHLDQVGYKAGNQWLVKNMKLSVQEGEFWAVIGPNGAGKSTLIKMISGELKPTQGKIHLKNQPLSNYSPEQMALFRGYLQQKREVSFPFQVNEIVEMGLYPQLKKKRLSQNSVTMVVENALKTMEMFEFRNRFYPSLSEGEATRVDIARVLAQESTLFLFDEPTNHLDPKYQLKVLHICSQLAAEGKSIIAVIHDLNLAISFATHVLVLKEGKCVQAGEIHKVLNSELLQNVYEVPFDVSTNSIGQKIVVPLSTI